MSTPFYDLASLVVVPSGYKASKVYAQKPLTTDGQLTFSRASTATRVNSAGLIETVSSNVPRLDYLGSTCPKLQLEPQRTNKQTNSEAINLTNYPISGGINVTTNAGAAPDGATTADKIIPTTTSEFHQVRSSGLATTSGYDIVSVFVKASGYNYVQLTSWANSGDYVNFDLTDGTVGTVSTATVYGIQSYGNGWYRIWANVQASGSGTVGIGVVTSKTAAWAQVFAGNGTDGVLMWGVQIEAGAYPTSYIPTTSAAVTRLGDVCNKFSVSSLIGQTEGTIFGEFSFPNTTSGESSYFYFTDGSFSNAVIIGREPTGGVAKYMFYINASGSNVLFNTSNNVQSGFAKLAIGYKSGSWAAYLNGTLVASGTNSLTFGTMSRIGIGTNDAGITNSGNSMLAKQAMLFKTRLTNAQLAELTAL